jgi:alpha-tubulin suppressor-like RCC1 family protein
MYSPRVRLLVSEVPLKRFVTLSSLCALLFTACQAAVPEIETRSSRLELPSSPRVPTRPPRGNAKVVAGIAFAVKLQANGTLVGMGTNAFGELGSEATNSLEPQPAHRIEAVSDIVDIASGCAHVLALKADGTVLSWGNDDFGQVGNDASRTHSVAPTLVPGVTNVVAVAAGCYHSLVLKADGTMLSWGQNDKGQLGAGGIGGHALPITVSGASGVVSIAAGWDHSLAVKSDGTLLTWGSDELGQLGDGGSNINRFTPTLLARVSRVEEVAGGAFHSLAVLDDGTVLSWGSNLQGQLGVSRVGIPEQSSEPRVVRELSGVVSVAAGLNFSLALRADGTVLTWGDHRLGQLGQDVPTGLGAYSDLPAVVPGLSGVTSLAARWDFSVALREDGSVVSWSAVTTKYFLSKGVTEPSPHLIRILSSQPL